MATPAEVQLARAHALTQRQLGTETVRQMLGAWRLVDSEDLDATIPAWLDVVVPLVKAQGNSSAQLANNYYRAVRTLNMGEAIAPVYGSVNEEALRVSLAVTGPISIKQAMTRGVPLLQADEIASARTAAAAMRHALNVGRETLMETMKADPAKPRWVRITTSPNPCDFCESLANGEPVAAEESAAFQAHDGCGCQPAPEF